MSRIVIVDYDMGNLASVRNAMRAVGYETEISPDPAVVAAADGIIMPGMGAFGNGMRKLAERGLSEAVKNFAAAGKPLLGICLGMQLLYETGEEYGGGPGLGLLQGRVTRLPETVKLPQIGWNEVQVFDPHPIFDEVPRTFYAYFDHSYAAEDIDGRDLFGTTEYGRNYPCVVARQNIIGIQFHPEKSSKVGLQLLANYGRLVCNLRSTRPSI